MNPQLTESKDSIGNVIVEDKMLQHLDNPGTLPQDKDLETLLQSCKDCQTSSVFDDSVISACGYSHYESLQSTLTQPWMFLLLYHGLQSEIIRQ